MPIIDCISDLHGFFPKDLPGGDLLIVSGDLTARDTEEEYILFFSWLRKQLYEEIIVIGGNHDNYLMDFRWPEDLSDIGEFIYLCDSGTEFEGLKIWGSPWTKRFPGMNPKCMAFTVDTDEELAEKWELIQDDTEILITHCPPFGIMDEVQTSGYKENCGSMSLLKRAKSLKTLKAFIFGHIHEGYGIIEPKSLKVVAEYNPDRIVTSKSMPYIINCSHVNERYKPVNKPIRIEL